MFIKLCGFTRNQDVEFVKDLPVSSVGFIFYKKSARYVSPERAAEMISILNGTGIKAAGVFVDDDPESIMNIVRQSGLDMVQVYSSRTADTLAPVVPVINCIRIGEPGNNLLPEPQPGGMVLFDSYSPDEFGGTGRSFSREAIISYPYRERMIVAGGINALNVKETIRELCPGGIDISSGIEVSPGIKSRDKISDIISKIMEAQNEIIA